MGWHLNSHGSTADMLTKDSEVHAFNTPYPNLCEKRVRLSQLRQFADGSFFFFECNYVCYLLKRVTGRTSIGNWGQAVRNKNHGWMEWNDEKPISIVCRKSGQFVYFVDRLIFCNFIPCGTNVPKWTFRNFRCMQSSEVEEFELDFWTFKCFFKHVHQNNRLNWQLIINHLFKIAFFFRLFIL